MMSSKCDGLPYSFPDPLNLTWDPGLRRKHFVETLFAGGFPYSRRLKTHSSCINAIAFSHGDGRFLVSGGDDLEIQLWDMYQDDLTAPSASFIGHHRNIFNLAFSARNKYLYSGGADDIILKYDMNHGQETGRLPTKSYTTYHDDSIRAISPHPFQEEVFLSGSEDGKIILHDSRERSTQFTRAQSTLQLTNEVTGVQFHPEIDNIFLTSDGHGEACLRDMRMAFGPARTRSHHGVVLTYATHLAKNSGSSVFSNPEISSLCFDRTGKNFCLTFLHYYPTIYSFSDPFPLAICSSHRPQEAQGYVNGCTMKHGTFGGPGLDEDLYYCGGSDDFRGYMWKIPPSQDLIADREVLSAEEWSASGELDAVAFCDIDRTKRIQPVNIAKPHSQLTGHISIVNTVAMHPQLPYIATCGIEKDLILHSPSSNGSCTQDLQLTPTHVRSVGANDSNEVTDRYVYFLALQGFQGELEEDGEAQTISMFDHIIRQERDTDIFEVRPWHTDDSDIEFDPERDSGSEWDSPPEILL